VKSDVSTYVVGLKQPIFAGGKLISSLRAAKAAAQSSHLSIYEKRYTLALQITSAYHSYLLYRGREEAQKLAVKRHETYAESMEKRVAQGVSGVVDDQLVQSRLIQARNDLLEATNSRINSLRQLQQLVSNSLCDEELASSEEVSPSAPASLDILLEKAFNTSAILKRMDADIKAAEQQIEVQKAVFWPAISVNSEYQNALSKSESGYEGSKVYFSAEFSPGSGLSSFSLVKAARAKITGLTASRESAKRELTSIVQQDYNNSIIIFNRLHGIQAVLETSQNVLESYKRLFIAGKRSWLDVLNAARELTQIEILYSDTRIQLDSALFRLKLHTGDFPLLLDSTDIAQQH